MKHIGTIAVKVFRNRLLWKTPIQEQESWGLDKDGVTVLAEKKLNITSATHSYRFGFSWLI